MTLIVDGIKTTADACRTLLDVAFELGIHIPTLCRHKALSPYGACRICLVEIITNGRSSLQTACTYPAYDCEVKTNSATVRKARKMILELMTAQAPDVDEIKKLAEEYGAVETKYNVHRVGRENRCIMCGLCVRICNELMNIGAIGFKGRGYKRKVTTPFNSYSDICSTCGACISVCPTNAIKMEDLTNRKFTPILSEFDLRLKKIPVMYMPFPQAVPNKPILNQNHCMYFKNNKACQICNEVCEFKAVDYNMKDETVEVEAGNIIVTTGFKTFDPKKIEQFGYGKYPNVYTSLEFERIVNASGPTDGNILLRRKDKNGNWIISPNGDKPKSVAIMHCVGSRDENYNKYCSKVCCMYSLKLAYLVKEKIPDATVYEYCIDVRAYGKGYEEFYERTKKKGVQIIKGKPAEIIEVGTQLILRSEDIEKGELVERKVDMVILSVGVEPGADSASIAQILGITRDESGWFNEANYVGDSVNTSSSGIMIAGLCQGPKDIPDTVAQASAAASFVLKRLIKRKIKKDIKQFTLKEIENRAKEQIQRTKEQPK